jgi:hypothetical protein
MKPKPMSRCPAISPGGSCPSGQLPSYGTQCGLEAGHTGAHHVITPTSYPWSPTRREQWCVTCQRQPDTLCAVYKHPVEPKWPNGDPLAGGSR